MSNENDAPPSPTSTSHRRRASFSPGQTFSELFARTPPSAGNATSAYPGPITTAAANAQAQNRRRMSLTTLGLSGTSPTQTSPFRARRESTTSIGSTSSTGTTPLDENVIEEGDATGPPPSSPFVRRMSFGARALRDVRAGNGNAANGRASTLVSSPTANGRGEGFNWSEQLRSRAEITVEKSTGAASNAAPSARQRATSTTNMPPPASAIPPASKVPDHFQERILKGDFYMD
ncbi:hypothetical protein GP486_002761 [Trichoglossum hirsutum]|uniref:Uncharacterized protein n=1 Tax=Trichoglossum hirsutum TaxID=265104 RepID=A0A9P8LEB8_9PEZI|nr:hypothetical protein GP486_002761 [Trichoglossum hirsutum]